MQQMATAPNRKHTHGCFIEQAAIADRILGAMEEGNADFSRLHPHERHAPTMIAMKLSRIVAGDSGFADHWVDIQGNCERVLELITNPAPTVPGSDFSTEVREEVRNRPYAKGCVAPCQEEGNPTAGFFSVARASAHPSRPHPSRKEPHESIVFDAERLIFASRQPAPMFVLTISGETSPSVNRF